MSRTCTRVFCSILLVWPAAARGQPATTLDRGRPLTEATFVRLSGARALPSGDVQVLDGGEARVWAINTRTGARTLSGAPAGPQATYDGPTSLFAAGKHAVLDDFRGSRFVFLNVTGAATAAAPKDSVWGLAFRRVSPRLVGIDDQGRLYFESPTVVIDPATGARGVDSSAIVRITWPRARVDTIAFLQLPPGSTVASGGRPGEGLSVRTGAAGRYAPYSTWAVAADGRVGIAHAKPYRVEWISPNGRRTTGPTIATAPIPISAAELRQATAGGAVGAGVGAQAADPGGAPSVEFTAKPPFERASALTDSEGRLWVRRSMPEGDSRGLYDVFGEDGSRVASFGFPARTRVIGFAAGIAYAAERTDDGERLLEFRLPRPGGRSSRPQR